MKKVITITLLIFMIASYGQEKKTPTLKSILLDQLKSTHNVKDWFVPANIALEGLTPEQALWKDNSGNHSVAQLANHLIFWNLQQLQKFKGLPTSAFDGNNDETFANLDKASWAATTSRLDSVFTAWEKAIETTDDKKLNDWYNIIAHINTHNAYHIGQIVFVRKEQGIWNADKGVK